jgi:hypothetical protein
MTFDLITLKSRVGDLNSLYPVKITFDFREIATKHYAKKPVKLSNGDIAHLSYYYKVWHRFTLDRGCTPKKIISENEFLIQILKDEIQLEKGKHGKRNRA